MELFLEFWPNVQMTNSKRTLFFILLTALFALQVSDVQAADTKKSAPKKTAAKKAAAPTPTPTPEAPTPSPSPVEPTPTPAVSPTPVATPTPVEEVKKEEAKKEEVVKEEVKSDLYGKKKRNFGDWVFGPYITLVSLPRPLSAGLEVKWWDLLGVSGSYGFLPEIKISGVTFKTSGTEGRFKIYPFRGAFYLGVGFGSQTFTGSKTETIQTISVTGTISQKNNFVAPQLGWNWTWDSGFFMGLDLGVQLSMSRTTTFTTNQDSNALITASAEYQTLQTDVNKMADLIGKTPLPLLTLIKVGYFF
jgi:hypothetical protein